MALWVATGRGLATGASTNVIELRASAQRVRLREVLVISEAATALNLGIFRTTTAGTAGTSVTPVKANPADGAVAGTTVVTGPTGGVLEATALERIFLPAVAGSAGLAYFAENEALITTLVAPGNTLILRNDVASAGPAITWKIKWEE